MVVKTYVCAFGCKHPLMSVTGILNDIVEESKRLYNLAYTTQEMTLCLHYLYESMILGNVKAYRNFFHYYRAFLKIFENSDVVKFIHEHKQTRYMDELLAVTFFDDKEFFDEINLTLKIDTDNLIDRFINRKN